MLLISVINILLNHFWSTIHAHKRLVVKCLITIVVNQRQNPKKFLPYIEGYTSHKSFIYTDPFIQNNKKQTKPKDAVQKLK